MYTYCNSFQVSVGEFFRETLDDRLTYVGQTQAQTSIPTEIIVPAVLVPLLLMVAIIIFFVAILYFTMGRTKKQLYNVHYQAGRCARMHATVTFSYNQPYTQYFSMCLQVVQTDSKD